MIPWASSSPQSKRHHDWFRRFRAGDSRVSLYFTMGAPFPHCMPMEDTIPWTHPSPETKQHLYRFSRFCTDDRKVSLYFATGRPFPIHNCPFPWEIWTPSNTWFPGPTRVLNPNGISIGSVVLAELISVTDRPTDHATRSVRISHIYIRSTAMRSNNTASTLHTDGSVVFFRWHQCAPHM